MSAYLAHCSHHPAFRAFTAIVNSVRAHLETGRQVDVIRRLRRQFHPAQHVEIAALVAAWQEREYVSCHSLHKFIQVVERYRAALWTSMKPEHIRLEGRIAEEFWIAQLTGYDRQSLRRLVQAINEGAPPAKAREAAATAFGPHDFRQRLLVD